jgi:superkiller protein 3
MSWKSFLSAVLILLLVAGCAQDKKPTQKEAAVKQWRDARATVLYSLAKDQYKNGNFKQCRQTMDEALKLAPDNVPLRVLSARVAIEQGQLELADRELSAARKLDEKDAEIDYLTGVIYQRWERPETAYEYYHSASEKQPAELAYVMAKSEMLVAMHRQDEALALLQSKVQYFEHSAVIRDAVGQLLLHKHKYSEAADMLRQATILQPDDLTLREHLSLALYFDGKWLDAIEQLDHLTSDSHYAQRADLWVMLGQCQRHVGQNRQARESFEKATEIDPNLASAWLAVGRCALQDHDDRRAAYAANRVLQFEPQNAEANLLIGYVSLHDGKLEEALAAFRKASALDSEDTTSLCMIGYVMEKMGHGSEAVKYYARALKIKPDDELASRLMAAVDVRE